MGWLIKKILEWKLIAAIIRKWKGRNDPPSSEKSVS